MEIEEYIEIWKEHFEKLNRRKPKKMEIMCFKVGFNGGEHNRKTKARAGLKMKFDDFIEKLKGIDMGEFLTQEGMFLDGMFHAEIDKLVKEYKTKIKHD